MKNIAWFSCGASSAVMCKITKYDVIAYMQTNSEHPDNERFLRDCEVWFGQPIIRLSSKKYKDVNDIIDSTNFLRNQYGARCTTELKMKVREEYVEAGIDVNNIGFTAEEYERGIKLTRNIPEYIFKFPLIERGITKQQCLGILSGVGIELPVMYKLGYEHNNCLGCVKSGSKKYWNMIRRDFPDVFNKRAQQERTTGYSLIKGVFLDELPEQDIDDSNADIYVCDLFCQNILTQNAMELK